MLSTAASYKQMDHAGRGVCVVRYCITLQPGGVGIVQKPAYSLINFMNDLGSASAILGIGYSLLAVWQKMTSKLVKKEDGLREKLDKLRERRRAVAQIAPEAEPQLTALESADAVADVVEEVDEEVP